MVHKVARSMPNRNKVYKRHMVKKTIHRPIRHKKGGRIQGLPRHVRKLEKARISMDSPKAIHYPKRSKPTKVKYRGTSKANTWKWVRDKNYYGGRRLTHD
jgi:hypothetical protein